MKANLLNMLLMSCVTTFSVAAQDYDDIYYDSSQESASPAKVETVESDNAKQAVLTVDDGVVADYFTADQTADWNGGNIVDLRDVDEYNRRGGGNSGYAGQDETAGEVAADSSAIAGENGDTFQYTERIRRFHDPDVIADLDDEETVDLYVYTRPDVNIIVGSPTTAYVSPWGATLSFNTWGWYDVWYDPWYWDPWYYRPYWYYTSWYRPYYWGWGAPYYAYHPHHYHSWWRPAIPHHRPYYTTYSGGKGRRLYANAGHRGVATVTSRTGRRAGTSVSNGTVTGRRRAAATVNTAANRLNGTRIAGSSSTLNRYKNRVNRTTASINPASANRVSAVAGKRVPASSVTGNRVSATTVNRVNRVPASTNVGNAVRRSQASTVKRGNATAVQRTNQLNRRSTVNGATRRSSSSFGTGTSGYRSTGRGTSYYRSNRSTSTYNRSSSAPSYNRGRSSSTYRSTPRTSNYNRGGSSSYRSTSRSSGYSRSAGASRGGGGGRRR